MLTRDLVGDFSGLSGGVAYQIWASLIADEPQPVCGWFWREPGRHTAGIEHPKMSDERLEPGSVARCADHHVRP
ncbi:hypothetical protein AWC11_08855 [Mycobacterium interjectum]|nr:hypothetical protein AWC11_08855 [Mycobacterium interjectum]